MYKEAQRFLGKDWSEFQRLFEASIATETTLLGKVNGYILAHGGKKLRPTFTLLTAKALRGFCSENVQRCAVASELLHCATLVHDDVVDNAKVRRGAPSLMALYSPTTAVLVGDYWLAAAVREIIDHPDKRVLHVYSKCLSDLAIGEMIQLERAQKADTKEEDYRRIIYCKTTSLFEASVLSAAYSVEATPEEFEICRKYAYHIGQSFQMMDDILDYSPELSIGKPTGQDIMEQKITLPLLCLFDVAPASVVRDIRRRMKKPDDTLVQDVFSLVRQYDALTLARKRLQEEIDCAVEAIAPLPPSEAKTYLEKLAGLMAVRTV